MTTSHQGQTPSAGSVQKPDTDQIQADIDRTREDLAETIDALTAKLDVKARTKQRLAETKQRAVDRLDAAKVRTNQLASQAKDGVTDAQGRPTSLVLISTGVVAASLVATGLLVWQRRRR